MAIDRRNVDWFQQLVGFPEAGYADTRAKLTLTEGRLHSLVNGKSYSIGELEVPSLDELRHRCEANSLPGRLHVSIVQGDVRALHREPEHACALFQVASQFNLLEMVGPNTTPEDGVTIYEHDGTQGPACAIAAGAATIYRNYFAPVDGGIGQSADRQIDALKDVGAALSKDIGAPVAHFWAMRNGYALCHEEGLADIETHLKSLTSAELDRLRGKLRLGLHWDVGVTDAPDGPLPVVSQAFCSALPVAYTRIPNERWKTFACLILEAAYEATMCAALINAQRGGSNQVLLTTLGGGAFGNDDAWIHAAISRALKLFADRQLRVALVSYSKPSQGLLRIVDAFR